MTITETKKELEDMKREDEKLVARESLSFGQLPESCKPWGDFTLMLFTPEALAEVPDGSILIDIFGVPVVKGPEMDTDTRFGMTAFGRLVPAKDKP